MRLPARMLPHTVVVKPLIGQGSYGPVYGTPFSLACRIEGGRKLVRSSTGSEVVVERTIYAAPTPTVLVGSEVTVDGTKRTVIATQTHTGRRDPVMQELNTS